jgi:hypothetical protein
MDDDLSISWLNIKLEEYDLLPSSRDQLLLPERHEQIRPNQRSSDMGVPVSVMPSSLMLVGVFSRRNSLQHVW